MGSILFLKLKHSKPPARIGFSGSGDRETWVKHDLAGRNNVELRLRLWVQVRLPSTLFYC